MFPAADSAPETVIAPPYAVIGPFIVAAFRVMLDVFVVFPISRPAEDTFRLVIG